MSIKINEHVLIIPPYLSTTWNQIVSLQMKENNLIVRLSDETTVSIPNLNEESITSIFEFHAQFLEQLTKQASQQLSFPNREALLEKLIGLDSKEPGVHIAFSTMDGMGGAMAHNPEQSNAPDLPKEVLEKITAITKIIAADALDNLPKPETDCNCFFCQLTRAMNPQEQTITIEEQVLDEELKFQEWDIEPAGVQLYSVTNKLDGSEKYNVFLGHPVGCTCGKSNCEHIVAVLKS